MLPTDRQDPADFVALCRAWARTRPDRLAYTWLRDGEVEDGSLTFGQLDARARVLGAELAARGLAGERALLTFAPGLEFVAAFLGCLYAGVVAVPLSAPREARAFASLLGIARHAAPAIVLADRAMRAALHGTSELLGGLEVLATDELAPDTTWTPGPIEPEQLAFVQYTSGSTGAPKGVELSHRNLIRDEQMIRAAFGHDERTVFVGWLPLFHDMGLVGNVLQPLFLGVHGVLMAPQAFVQRPLRWLEAIARYRATTSGGPNFGYELCARKAEPARVAALDLSGWRVAFNGSEPVRADTLERFARACAPAGFRRESLYPCYGLAEAALFVTGGTPGAPLRVLDVEREALQRNRLRPVAAGDPRGQRLVGCGRPWLDQRVCIVDPRTRVEVAAGEVGEVWLQGGNVARGYRAPLAESPDPFHAYLDSGAGPFLATGDLGCLHAGELFLTGRLKDLLIQRGRNHYPQDIELVASHSHAELRPEHAAAFALEAAGDERLVLVLEVQRESASLLERADAAGEARRAELAGAVRAAVAQAHGLQVWKVVLIEPGTLPRTTSGKVQRRETRELWRRGELPELGRALGV